MIDFGLLASMLVALAVPSALARRWPVQTFAEPVSFIDAVVGPLMVGLIVGRVATLFLDDPRALGRVADVLVVRSGVEFWPAALAAGLASGWGTGRGNWTRVQRVAALAPLSMVGYGSYEASCVLRAGCFGPASSLGLRPVGVSSAMMPVGVLMGAAVVLGAVWVRRLSARRSALVVAVAAVWVVAFVRSVASLWLPRVGGALTRQHRSSLVVGSVATVVLAGARVVRRPGPGVVAS